MLYALALMALFYEQGFEWFFIFCIVFRIIRIKVVKICILSKCILKETYFLTSQTMTALHCEKI